MSDPSPAILASIDELFERRVTQSDAPGVYYAVFTPWRVIHEAGFGVTRLGGGTPDADTAFRIASCTKSFTSATLLTLRDRGLLNLDAPITDFVPAFVPNTPENDPVTPTVRMLMTMSGGLPTDDPWGDRQEAMTRAELDAYLAGGVPTVSVPGTKFEYSNLGYALLGQVIAEVTGEPYFDVVQREQFDRLGMASTGYDAAVVPGDRLALGYRRRRGEWVELPFSDKGVFSSMGGIFSTGADLIRWVRWLMAGTTPSVREQQQINRAIPSADAVTSGYGYGLFVEHDPVWGTTVHHSGGYPGFSTHMRWNAQSGIGIVAFENATYSGVSVPASEALRRLQQGSGAPDLKPTPWPETLAMIDKVQQLARNWDDALADSIFTDNVAQDIPYSERAESIAFHLNNAGDIDWTAPPIYMSSSSPAQLTWFREGSRERLRFDILLAPTTPPLIQRITVRTPVY
jgi:CubicO group peptidase (beta-lactamase class C family)